MTQPTESLPFDQPVQARHYWDTHLADALPLLAMPTDFPRPSQIVDQSDVVRIALSPATDASIRALCAQEGIDPGVLFLGVYQVFLHRYSGQADVVVGVQVAANYQAGPANNRQPAFMPLRQTLDAHLPFNELLARNQRLREQGELNLPFETASSELRTSHAPVYQHRFSFFGTDGKADPTGLLDTTFTLTDGTDGNPGFHAVISFNTCLFERASAERWAKNIETLLESVCATPTEIIGELDLLHAAEKAFIAASLNHCTTPFTPRYPSAHASFEQQVEKTPESIALRCGTRSLTYAQLNERADAIAEHLHKLGARPGDLIGICTARTPDMIAGVIGILKLGAAYVPMDIKYPVLRLDSIVEEAQLKFVLVDERGSGLITTGGIEEILLSSVQPAVPSFERPVIDDEALCHVIFTSGSTGKPKGVMARHRNVMAFLAWIWAHYSDEELRVVLCCSSLCFDLTVFEIWGPLSVGGAIVLVDSPVSLVQETVADLTLVNTVPTALRLLVDEMKLPATVKAVNVCGEPLDGKLVADLFSSYPGVVFYNTYGPTEDTAYSTFYKMTGPVAGDPPIGTPLIYEYGKVVDAYGAQVPVGAVGELRMGGAGVTKGYLNNPQQTAAGFINATDYAGNAAMEYRTGDFVRLRADGQLHFVGRRDDQVKLRGFRIDLGDVVTAIDQIPGITDTRVLVQRHKTGDVLVAYVSHSDMPPGLRRDPVISASVEAGARARLPAYMVPGFFVLFDKLPLNANGKVDRHALNAIDFDPEASSTPDEAMSDDEQAIAEIWKTVLLVEQVSRDDDFFQLGGNSLLAVRMIARMNKTFGLNLPIQIIFEDRTIAAMALRVREQAKPEEVPLERVDLDNGVSPTYPQMAMLMEPNKTSFNLCSAMWIEGAFDTEAMRRSLAALLERHDALRASFRMVGPMPQMHIAATVPDILSVIDLSGQGQSEATGEAQAAEQRQVKALLDAEWSKPFDLNAGLPIRALLIRLSPQRHVFMLSVHHVVTDEWTTNILKNDITRFYAAELDATLAKPAPLPIRYGDYASWQAKLHTTEDYGRQFIYWTGELKSLRAGVTFPAPVATPLDAGCATRYLKLVPPAGLDQTMETLSARYGYTRYVVVMAALQLALAAYSGLEQQLVWTPVARRTRPELEEVAGMFSNLTVIIAECSPALSLGEFLALIDRKISQARNNSDVSALTAVMRNPRLMPMSPMIGLNYIDLPNQSAWAFQDATVVPVPFVLEQETDILALELTVRVVSGSVEMTMAYDTAKFDANGVDRIVATLWAMIENFESTPERCIADILPKQT